MKRVLIILCVLALALPLSVSLAASRDTAGECAGYRAPTPTPAPTPEPGPTPVPTPSPTPEPYIPPDSGSPEFPGPFLPEGSRPQITASSYRSSNVVIRISSQRCSNSDVFVADIHVRKLDYLRRAYGANTWAKRSAWMSDLLAQTPGSLLAITGDSSGVFKNGLIIGNGELQKKTSNLTRDAGVLWKDGTFSVYTPTQLRAEKIADRADEIWQTFIFGPFLLSQEDGHALSLKEMTNCGVKPANPRAVFGYYEPGHYCFVLVDGRSTASRLEAGRKNRGIRIEDLAVLMESLGCTQAVNLDGGQSAVLTFLDDNVSNPYQGGRRIGDAIMIVDEQ